MNPTEDQMDGALFEVWAATRRAVAEVRAKYAADSDGQMDMAWRVLQQKRGCRR